MTTSGSTSASGSGATGTGSPASGRLTRSRDSRHIAGVAGGLARHFGIDPTLVRVGFVVLTILGGSGIGLYLLGWLLLPEEDAEESLGMQLVHHRPGEPWPVSGVVIAVIAALVLAGAVAQPFGAGFLIPAVIVAVAVYLLTSRGDAAPPAGGPPGNRPWGGGPGGGPGGAPSPPPPPSPGRPAEDTAPPAGPPPDATAPVEDATDPLLSDPIVTDPLGLAWRDSYERWPAPAAVAAPPVPVRTAGRRITAVTMSLVVSLAGVILLLDVAGLAHVGVHGFSAAALVIVGSGLLVSAWAGRAWALLPVALALMVAVALTSGSWRPRAIVGSRHFEPASAAALRHNYRVTFGDLDLDLRDLTLDSGSRRVRADVVAGRIVVTVPAGLPVDVDARSGAGRVEVFDRIENGPGSRIHTTDQTGSDEELLVLDLRAGAGDVEVHRAA